MSGIFYNQLEVKNELQTNVQPWGLIWSAINVMRNLKEVTCPFLRLRDVRNSKEKGSRNMKSPS